MPIWSSDDAPPLPRDWLPEGSPREGTSEWELLVARVLVAAEPGVLRLRAQSTPAESWPSVLGSWWRQAAALAAAAAALLLIVRPEPPRPVPDALPLTLVTAQGEPAAILAALGVEADPVLALIMIEGMAP